MSCHEIAPLLELVPLLDDDVAEQEGLLDAEERSALRAHLDACAACRERAEGYQTAYGQLAEAQETTMEPLSTELRERVLAGVEQEQEGKKPALEGPTVDPIAVEALRGKIALSCSFCHDTMERTASVFCASCLAPHHRECFAEHGSCSLPGCDETRTVQPSESATPPRRKKGVVISLIAALGVGTAVAAAAIRERQMTAEAFALTQAANEAAIDAALARESAAARELEAALQRDLDLAAEALPGAALDDDGFGDPPPPDYVEEDLDLLLSGEVQVLLVGEGRIDLNTEDASLAAVMMAVSEAAGLNVLVDPNVNEIVSISLRDIPVDEAIDVIARMTRCEVEQIAGEIRLLTQPPKVTIQFTSANVRTLFQLLAAYSGKNIIMAPDVTGTLSVDITETHWLRALYSMAKNAGLSVCEADPDTILITTEPLPERVVAGLRGAAPEALPEEPGDASDMRIDVDLENVDLTDACDQIGRRVGRNILVDPNVDERVSCNLSQLPWREAVELLARLARCQVEDRGHGILLLTQPPAMTLQTSNCSLRSIYQLLAAQAGFNVVINEEVTGWATLDVKEIHFARLLLALAAVHGHEVELGEDSVSLRAGDWGPKSVHAPSGVEVEEQDDRLTALLKRITELARARDHEALEAAQAELRALIEPQGTDSSEVDQAALASARDDVEALLEQIGDQLEVRDTDALETSFKALRPALDRYFEREDDTDRELAQLAQWFQSFEALGDGGQSVRLFASISFSNHYLRAMNAAMEDQRFDTALKFETEARKILSSLREVDSPVFEDNAQALEDRLEDMSHRTRALQQIAGAQLEVQALLNFADEAGGADAAIVTGDILREGSELEDARFVLIQIDVGSVRFRFEDQEFVRELAR